MKRTGRIGLTGFFVVGLIVTMFGCTNVDQTIVPPTDYHSTVMFVDLANTGTSMAIKYDQTAVGTLNFGNHSASYASIPSGTRRMSFTYGASLDTLNQGLSSNYQYSYFSIYEPLNGDVARKYVLAGQTYTFGAAGVKDTALVRFFNLSSDTVATFLTGFDFILADTLETDGVGYPGWTSYMKVRAGNNHYTVLIDATGDTLSGNATLSNLASLGRYSVIIYGNNASIQTLVLTEH